ncbi:hypothetical protein RCL1_002723 [Eukaryota sp. TZLM3-RCL]
MIEQEQLNRLKAMVLSAREALVPSPMPPLSERPPFPYSVQYMVSTSSPTHADVLMLKSGLEDSSLDTDMRVGAIILSNTLFDDKFDNPCRCVGYPHTLSYQMKIAQLLEEMNKPHSMLLYFPDYSVFRNSFLNGEKALQELCTELLKVKTTIEDVTKLAIVIDGQCSLIDCYLVCFMASLLGFCYFQLGHAFNQSPVPSHIVCFLLDRFPTLHFSIYTHNRFKDYLLETYGSQNVSLVLPHDNLRIIPYSCCKFSLVDKDVLKYLEENRLNGVLSSEAYKDRNTSASHVSLNNLDYKKIQFDRFHSFRSLPSYLYYSAFQFAYVEFLRLRQCPSQLVLNDCSLSDEILTKFADLHPLLCGCFPHEDYRQKIIFKALEIIFESTDKLSWYYSKGTASARDVSNTTDAPDTLLEHCPWKPDIALIHSELHCPVLIVQVNNERTSSTSADPAAQAVTYYCEYMSSIYRIHSRFGAPCFIMTSDGTHLYLYSVCLIGEFIRCSLLFDFEFSIHWNFGLLVRFFEILKLSSIALMNEYNCSLRKIIPLILLGASLPQLPPQLQGMSMNSIPQHPMQFFGSGSYATFLRNKHSIDAQYSLSLLNSAAPIERVEQVGEWFFVKSLNLESILSNHELLIKAQAADLKKSLEKFHDFGFVHGDARLNNIVREKFLVDFETAGLLGHARYSSNYNLPPVLRRNQFYPSDSYPFKEGPTTDSIGKKIYPPHVLVKYFVTDWDKEVKKSGLICVKHDMSAVSLQVSILTPASSIAQGNDMDFPEKGDQTAEQEDARDPDYQIDE